MRRFKPKAVEILQFASQSYHPRKPCSSSFWCHGNTDKRKKKQSLTLLLQLVCWQVTKYVDKGYIFLNKKKRLIARKPQRKKKIKTVTALYFDYGLHRDDPFL